MVSSANEIFYNLTEETRCLLRTSFETCFSQLTMAVTKEKKQEVLQELIDKFSRSKAVIFTGYRGLDVSGISNLRSELRKGGSECKVAKKTLIELAAKEAKIDGVNSEIMEGPVAVTFSYEDELSGLKVLFKFAKGNETLKLLGGVVDGKVVTADEVRQLAQLPSKEELYAKMLGSLNAPVSGFVGVLSNVMSGFVRVLDAYKNTLPADGTPVEVKNEAPAPAEVAEAPAEESVSEMAAEPESEEEKSAESSESAPE